jgi:hypothetical protein
MLFSTPSNEDASGTAFTLSPLERHLLLRNSGGEVIIHDPRTGEARGRLGTNMQLSPDEDWVLNPPHTCATQQTPFLERWIFADDGVHVVASIDLSGWFDRNELPRAEAAVSGDGAFYAVLIPGRAVLVFRARDDARVATLATSTRYGLAFSVSGRRLSALGAEGRAVVFDLRWAHWLQ